MKKLILMVAVLVASLPAGAAVVRFRGGFGYGYAPYGYGYGPWVPGYGYAVSNPNAGQLKFETDVKDAEVFINGAFAGTVGKLKTMTLMAGDYNLELRAVGRDRFAERVFIAPGKTLKLHPDLHVK